MGAGSPIGILGSVCICIYKSTFTKKHIKKIMKPKSCDLGKNSYYNP